MSFIQQTIKCNHCSYEMNISTGTLGGGIPKDCPNCKRLLDFEVISQGWKANNMKTTNKIEDLIINRNRHLKNANKCDREIWELLKKYRTKLPKKEYTVLKMRLKDKMILEKVAKEFGVTRERIRQIEAKAMEKLRLLQEGYILKGNRVVWDDILKQQAH